MTISIKEISSLVDSISQLGKQLPKSVPEGTRQDKLYTALKSINEGNIWETFNRCFDILLEDCHDEHCRLHHICHGHDGIGAESQYLAHIVWILEGLLRV